MGSTGGRFFGWVIGGVLPIALATDWLTSAWDQNAASSASSPAAAVVEEICGGWLKDLLGLPGTVSFAFVTGCQMAHTTALAAARHRLLRDRGVDVEAQGLSGAPAVRVLVSEQRHESILRSVRLLGIGTGAVESLPCDERGGGLRLDALAAALDRTPLRPTVVCLQAGDLNTGAFDSFEPACTLAHAAHAWVHVDGAFGLWVATSDRYRHLLAGVERADSWATDGHKWLNLAFDSGFVFVADPAAHSAVFSQPTSYAIPVEGVRDPKARSQGLEPRVVATRAGLHRLRGDPIAGPVGHRPDRGPVLYPRDETCRGPGRPAGSRGTGPTDDQSGAAALSRRRGPARSAHRSGDRCDPGFRRGMVWWHHLAGQACHANLGL